jgi:phage host-nuclease inhibitor protein Gam
VGYRLLERTPTTTNRREVRNINIYQRYLAVANSERELKDELESLKEERERLEQAVLDELAEGGLTSVTIDGRTIYTRRDIFPRYPQGKEAAIKLVLQGEFREIAKTRTDIHHQTMRALLKELSETDSLPPEWEGVIEVGEVYRVGNTAASRD